MQYLTRLRAFYTLRRAIVLGCALLLVGAWPLAWTTLPPPSAARETTTQWRHSTATRTPSPVPTKVMLTTDQTLERTWASYRHTFIQHDGRTIDPFRDQATTSEGQSYALLRAVWMDDRATFDNALIWTNSNLRVRGDHLFGYLWGQRADTTWGILDTSVASDADQDIALALLIAAQRWGDERYHTQAQEIIGDLWQAAVVEVRGRPYLTAGDWATAQPAPALNPSYLAPYAYRIFAKVDSAHPWASLVDTSYEVIAGCSSQPLDQPTSANLPPNWCAIDRTSGAFVAPKSTTQQLDTNFGYDAFRTYWRVALDARQHGDARAVAFLHSSDTLHRTWQRDGRIAAVYRHDGVVVRADEDLTMYGGLMASMLVTDRAASDKVVATQITPSFIERDGTAYWSSADNYYLQNWLWFGLALYADRVVLPQE